MSEPGKDSAQTPQMSTAEQLAALTPDQKAAAMAMVIGEAVWLMMHAPGMQHYFISDLQWILLPALASGQFRRWKFENGSMGFAAWAMVSEEVERRLDAGGRIGPGEWTSGDRKKIIMMMAPPGMEEKMRGELG